MKTPLTRRTLLRSLGGITIGLPLLEEMLAPQAHAAAAAVPVRAFNVFFGLGIPSPLQKEGFDGVLEPLKELQDKLLVLRNVDQVRVDKPGINAHYDGSSGAFTAEPPDGEAKSGGPSIDQVIRQAHYAKGLPPGMVPTLIAGTFFRRDRVSRYAKSFNADGTVAGQMCETPREVFARVFGDIPGADIIAPTPDRHQRSILDSVLDQYHHFAGPNSPLGSASKSRLTDHLDRIREFEQRVFTHQNPARLPNTPPDSKLPHGGRADPGGEGIDITLADLTAEWHLLADLYAFAIQTDRVRFGSINFLAAGERIRLKGSYKYGGKKRFDFDDSGHRKSGGANGCSHEWWHAFNENQPNTDLRAHAHMKMREVAWFLKRLDTSDCLEPNGRTILENSMITISTESGDGRHNDVKRELSGIFHAITPANGRFKTGQILDLNSEGLDLYNTLLSAHDIKSRLGPKTREHRPTNAIRA